MSHNESTHLLDRATDCCIEPGCGVQVEAGDIYCAKHE